VDPAHRAAILKYVWDLTRKYTEAGADMSYASNPEGWTVADAKVVVANLRVIAEQLYAASHVVEETFPAPVELNPASMTFLKWLGVPISSIAETADLARGTVYSKIDGFEDWARTNGVVISGV